MDQMGVSPTTGKNQTAATESTIDNYALPSNASAAVEASNQTQEISDDAEDNIFSISSVNHNSTDQRSRGHPEEIRPRPEPFRGLEAVSGKQWHAKHAFRRQNSDLRKKNGHHNLF